MAELRVGWRVRHENGRTATVVMLYEGMKTGTPYALVHWDDDRDPEEIHVVKQKDLTTTQTVP